MIDLREGEFGLSKGGDQDHSMAQLLHQFVTNYESLTESVSRDNFYFPVDQAVKLAENEVIFPPQVSIILWENGRISDIFHSGLTSLIRHGNVEIAVSFRGVTMYISFNGGPISIIRGTQGISIEFHACTDVFLGMDTLKPIPPWIQTTPSIDDLARAVSSLGGVFEHFGPSRALIGDRPVSPAIVFGDEFETAPEIAIPDHPVRIEISRAVSELFTVAPLAYYLGAEVVPKADGQPTLEIEDRQIGLGYAVEAASQRVPSETLSEAVAICCRHFRTLDSIHRAEESVVTSHVDQAVLELLARQGFGTHPVEYRNVSYIDRLHQFADIPIGLLEPVLEPEPAVSISSSPMDAVILPELCYLLKPIHSPPRKQSKEQADVQQVIDQFYDL